MSEHLSLSDAVRVVNQRHGLDVGYQTARDGAIRNKFPAQKVDSRWMVLNADLPKLAAAFGAPLETAG